MPKNHPSVLSMELLRLFLEPSIPRLNFPIVSPAVFKNSMFCARLFESVDLAATPGSFLQIIGHHDVDWELEQPQAFRLVRICVFTTLQLPSEPLNIVT